MDPDLRRRITSLRRGDELRVTTIADLAVTVVEALAALELIHSQGAVALDGKGRRSDRDSIAMLQDAMPKLRKGLTRKVATRNGSKGGRAPNKKMDREKAEAIWHDGRYTIPQKLEKMTGWYYALAQAEFGATGRKRTGRPKINRKRIGR